jgi:histone H3/H4
MARVKADAKKLAGQSRAETVAKAKMDEKFNPSKETRVIGTTAGGKTKAGGGEPKKKRRVRAGTKALREIREQQSSVKTLITKAAMSRIVREIIAESTTNFSHLRVTPGALDALQQAVESFGVDMFELANLGAIHAKRVTVMPPDIDHTKTMYNRFTPFKFKTKYDEERTTIAEYRAKVKEANRIVNEMRAKRKAEKLASAAAEAAAEANATTTAAAAPPPANESQLPPAAAADANAVEPKKTNARKTKKTDAPATAESADNEAEKPAAKKPRKPAAKKTPTAPAKEAVAEASQADGEAAAGDGADLAI